MKRLFFPIICLLCALMTACEKYETYADMKAKEQDAISRFINKQGIQVISEELFNAQGNTTDVASNQYVRFDRTGVYMQIVRQGCGEKLEENKSVTLLCRFQERNLLLDSVLIRNDQMAYYYISGYGSVNVANFIDKMSVERTGTTITASFISGMMYQYHGSSTVPGGWLVPLNYVNVGRPNPLSDDDEVAKVRLIVPHSQGTADASASVYPCYYEITYERER
ncbi:MAG: DUF4827 domain-containing protein [Prevotella sp.]|nr:DUF4827 domain-containing protein [Prevotella sp.]